MKVFASEHHMQHHAFELSRGRMIPSVESPERAHMIATQLEVEGFALSDGDCPDDDLLHRVHTEAYIEFLRTAWDRWQVEVGNAAPAMAISWPERSQPTRRPKHIVGQLGFHSFGADCSIVAGTWEAAFHAAGLAQSAADHVASGNGPAYALCRPPGHHATKDQFGGYCYINNSAIAAQRLVDRGHKCVAILDVDYHHGNGTQAIFYERADVLTASIHANPADEFPWFTGYADEEGAGAGRGCNINLPLPLGSGRDAFFDALVAALKEIETFGATALVIALGTDAFVDDPLGTFQLSTDDFFAIGERVSMLSLPVVSIQEGGYANAAIGANVSAYLRGLVG
ncbi:MAG: histone deacetylase family protein [Woeseiaceae bacterium]